MYDATFKIVIFGDFNVGKDLITQRFLTNLFVSDSKMTIGVDFEVKSLIVDNQRVKLQIWDFGGEERFRSLLPTYVRGTRGGLFFYDTTNYSSFAHMDDWLNIFKTEVRKEHLFPIIAVGNKADLVKQIEITAGEAVKFARSKGFDGVIEISCKTGENVDEMFEALIRLMLSANEETKPLKIVENILEQIKENVQKYITEKSKTNKQMIRATTIKAIKKSLIFAEKNNSWDDDIWSFAISLSKSVSKRTTPKTIYFKKNR